MKTAVLTNENHNEPASENVSLTTRHNIELINFKNFIDYRRTVFNYETPEKYDFWMWTNFKGLLKIDGYDFQNCLYFFEKKEILQLIHFLHSLRLYFKSKVNSYFCDTCLSYFKEVILLETFKSCNDCCKRVASGPMLISLLFNQLYSIIYPFEPNAHMMGCLCTVSILKKRPYIFCGCIYTYRHLDHKNIFNKIIKYERRLWNKIYDVSLYYPSHNNDSNISLMLKDRSFIPLLPFCKGIAQSELIYLHLEYYKVLFEFFVNSYYLSSKLSRDQYFNSLICINSSPKAIFSNFPCLFHYFMHSFEEEFNISIKECCNPEVIKNESNFVYYSFQEIFLLFGIYVYCLKILKCDKKNAMITSKLLLERMDIWQKRKVFKMLRNLFNFYNISSVRECNSVYRPGYLMSNHDRKKGCFHSNDLNKLDLNKSSYCLKVKNDQNHTFAGILKFDNSFTGEFNDHFKSYSFQNDNHLESLETCTKSKNMLEDSRSFKSFQKSNYKNYDHDLNTVSTGKEELDIIDGVNIYSFETEPDMMEFAMLHNKHFGLEDNNLNVSNPGRIVPTKTRDITKIKGWRNKLFCMNRNERNPIKYFKSLCLNPTKDESMNSKPADIFIKEEPLDNSPENYDKSLENNSHIDMDGGLKIKQEVSSLNNSKIKRKKDLDSYINDLKQMYNNLISEQNIFKKFTKEICNDEGNEGVFESDILDDFLKNDSDLDISFEMSENLNEYSSSDFLNSAVVDQKNEKAMNTVYTKEEINQIVSADFFQKRQGDLPKRKYNSTKKKSLMVENGKKRTQCNSKKRVSNYPNSNLEVSPEKELKRVRKMKVTKNFNHSIESENDHSDNDTSLEVKPKKPYLSLLNTMEVDEADDETILADSLPKLKFPLVFPCTTVKNGHKYCINFNQIKLGMVINVGYKRPLSKEVEKNVEKLKKDETTVDLLWAHIAASALILNKGTKTVKRYIVPVVSDSLTEVVKFNIENVSMNIGKLNELNVQSVYRSINESKALIDGIEAEIKEVVDDIIEYVVKRDEYEMLTFPYDPDVPNTQSKVRVTVKKAKRSKVEMEIKRLMNVTLVDDRNEVNGNSVSKDPCGNEHCLKGCICNSLSGKLSVLHCGKLECMFECKCDSDSVLPFNCFQKHDRNKALAKDESSWHQTVICKNNKIIEVKGGAVKTKRETKLPTRYRNNVLLGKEMNCLDLYPPSSPENTKKTNSLSKSLSPHKDKDNKCKEKEFSIKDKLIKVKENDKDTRIKVKHKESKLKDKEIEHKVKEKCKDTTLNLVDSENRMNVDDVEEEKRKEKAIGCGGKDTSVCDNVTEKEKSGKLQVKKVMLPFKAMVKKVDSKHKAQISANLKQILNYSDLKKIPQVNQEDKNKVLTLADVFVWCSIHVRYSCYCSAQVILHKNNSLVWKPSTNKANLASKQMPQIVIGRSLPKCQLYDQNNHSARTFGSIFNYRLRNSNPVFKSKRLNEIVNNVLSNTNSFLKIDFYSNKPQSPNTGLQNIPVSDANKPTLKVINNGLVKKLIPNLKPGVFVEANKRKRSSMESEDEKFADKMNSESHITASDKDEIVHQNKKRYRIGPAHFDFMGGYRTIVSNLPPKNNKPKVNDQIMVNSGDFEAIPSINANETRDNESKILPKYGLLCLTQGFGYLPVKEFTPKKLQVQDPLSENVFHCFKDIESANKWLNRFFKNRIVFESLSVNLKWVIVKPGILKHSQPFDKTILENPSKIVNKDGCLVDLTNIKGNVEHSIRENKMLTDEPQKIKILNSGNEINDIPFKKPKISCDSTPKGRSSIKEGSLNRGLILSPVGVLQKINLDGYSNKTPVVSPTNNHSAFFRLNNTQKASLTEGRFIPILPKPVHKKEIDPDSLPNANVGKSCKSVYSIESNKKPQENLIISRLTKTIPSNSRALPGKSILKKTFNKV